MILKNQIITNIIIENVNDLYKLKPFLEDGTLRINKSQIARELEVDRRTVDKYINGYTKPKTRNCDDCITDNVYQLIKITHSISNVIIMSKLINGFGQRFPTIFLLIIVFTAFT